MGINLDKIKFTEEEIRKKLSNRSSCKGSLFNLFKNIEDQQYLEPGQVLVLRQLQDSYRTKAGSLEKNRSGAVQKYIVANKIEGNLVLCRKLGINGRPGKSIHIIADHHNGSYRFEEDPDIADSILLEFDYDPLLLPKQMGKARHIRKKFNKSISIEVAAATDSSYVGDREIAKMLVDRINTGQLLLWSMDKKSVKTCYTLHSANTDEVVISKGGSNSIIITMRNICYGYKEQFFISEPMTEEEALFKVRSK